MSKLPTEKLFTWNTDVYSNVTISNGLFYREYKVSCYLPFVIILKLFSCWNANEYIHYPPERSIEIAMSLMFLNWWQRFAPSQPSWHCSRTSGNKFCFDKFIYNTFFFTKQGAGAMSILSKIAPTNLGENLLTHKVNIYIAIAYYVEDDPI